jgi:Protein of unknown function (DUF3570)
VQLTARAVAPAVVLALALGVSMAHAEDEAPPKTESAAPPPEDTSTKRASFEVAAYRDSDHVTVLTPSVAGVIENVTTGASISGRYLVDVVSAASVDVVSTASRKWTEVRHAGSVAGAYKPKNFGVQISGSSSSEPDYFAYNIAAQMIGDFDEKNTSLTAGYGFGHDTIGRADTPFAVFSRELTRGSFNGGVTQVIDKATIAALGMDLVIERGDQSKPYRYIPMFSSAEALNVPKGASIDYVNAHRLVERPLEQLPLARNRFAFSGRVAHRFDTSTLRASERFYTDNWSLHASTTDVRWIWDVGTRFAIGPHARFHIQTPVSFWKRAYVAGAPPGFDLPELRTGDRELGPLFTLTGGGAVKWFLGSASDPRAWAIGVEGDGMYTSFLDDLYVSSRGAFLGTMIVEGTL